MAASTPMIATTIINSIKVKPLLFVVEILANMSPSRSNASL